MTSPRSRHLGQLGLGMLLALWQLDARADLDEKGLIAALGALALVVALWLASVLPALLWAKPHRKAFWATLAAVGLPCTWLALQGLVSWGHRADGGRPTEGLWMYGMLVGAFLVALVLFRRRRADPRPDGEQRAVADTDLLVLLLLAPVVATLPGDRWARDLLMPGWRLWSALSAWESAATLGLCLLAAFGLWRRHRWAWWLALVLVALRSMVLLDALRAFVSSSFTGYDHSGGAATLIAVAALPGFVVLGLVYAGAWAVLLQPALLGAFFPPGEGPRRWFARQRA